MSFTIDLILNILYWYIICNAYKSKVKEIHVGYNMSV